MPAEVMLRSGKGGRIWDERHGKEYVDFLLGSGPMFITATPIPEVRRPCKASCRAG